MNKKTIQNYTQKRGVSSRRRKAISTNVLMICLLFAIAIVTLCIWFLSRPTLEKAENMIAKGRFDDGINILTKLADSGDVVASARLGLLYKDGAGGYTDSEQTVKYLRLAAASGNTQAQIALADTYIENGTDDKEYAFAFGLMTQFEQSSNASALGILGKMYFNGYGTGMDREKAYQLLSKASNLGNRRFDYLLGIMSYNGDGTEKNLGQAERYLASTPIGASSDVDCILGKIYYQNNDFQKAARRLLQCNANGDPEASFYLGRLLYDGVGGHQDYAEAEKHLLIAKQHGVGAADFLLGMIYLNGVVNESPDHKKAFEHLMAAADDKVPEAYPVIGRMYYEGLGVQ